MTVNQNELPWEEKIPAISVFPEMATLDDIARMAAELMELRQELPRIRKEVKRLKCEGELLIVCLNSFIRAEALGLENTELKKRLEGKKENEP